MIPPPLFPAPCPRVTVPTCPLTEVTCCARLTCISSLTLCMLSMHHLSVR
jgi:hypothetical protein